MGKSLKRGFKSEKQLKRLQKISSSTSARNKRNLGQDLSVIYNDHVYARAPDGGVCHVQVPDTDDTVHPNYNFSNDWREGRHVVELGVLADALAGCKKCGLPIQLSHACGITNYGLSAIIKIRCMNTTCEFVNNVPTGKRHRRIWDANTKLATAAVHVGIGCRQVNGFLAALNIPPVSENVFRTRKSESGVAIEKVAGDSMRESMEEEKKLTIEKSGAEELSVSVDGAWQKRGSGRSYDSLSGHCSMIGVESGKIVQCAVRCKFCKVCDAARAKREMPKPHDCRLNWHGSAKSMEQDMVVDMVSSCQKQGFDVKSIVADEDSTTIASLHQKVDPNIIKISDRNHIKKNIANRLFSLQKKFKKLTTKVIKYLQKCLNYMLSQNQGNPEGIILGLDAIGRHPFGDHSKCQDSWCNHILEPDKKFSALPYGKPLSDASLQAELRSLLDDLKKQSVKLAHLGSTQSNESFNKMVSSKAPKSNFYSGSANLSYRVAACVAQKNMGQNYLLKVNKALELSPGEFTRKLAVLRHIQDAKRRALGRTVTVKRKRIEHKSKRVCAAVAKEMREGPTYESGIGLKTGDISGRNDTLMEIPHPIIKPKLETLPTASSDLVFFDLETTGLARTSHIVQIAAVCRGDKFSSYIMPKQPFTPSATEITGLYEEDGVLYHHGKRVDATTISHALDSFFSFLQGFNDVILVGHNIKLFDCPVLLNALKSCSMLWKMQELVLGFLDTRILFKITHPNLPSYSQENLSKMLLQCSYNAHDALEDVKMLSNLMSARVSLCDEKHKDATFTCRYALDAFHYNLHMNENYPSLQCLVDEHVISVGIAKKIAGSGLNYDCLKLAHTRSQDGINVLFTEQCDGITRVTKSKRIIDAVKAFFLSLTES